VAGITPAIAYNGLFKTVGIFKEIWILMIFKET
jgi:hypothetical protein